MGQWRRTYPGQVDRCGLAGGQAGDAQGGHCGSDGHPLWAAFDIMLKASVTSLRNSQNLWRWDVWGDTHGSVKNTLVFLNQYVEEPEPDLEEIRSLTRNALVVVDEWV